MISHLTEADLKKLLQIRENIGNGKEKVGIHKPPIKLPDGFRAVIGTEGRSNIVAGEDPTRLPTRLPPRSSGKTAKNYLALFILIALIILIYSFNKDKKV